MFRSSGPVLLLLLLAVAFVGCKKKEAEPPPPRTAPQTTLEDVARENVKRACDAGDGPACWKTYGSYPDDAGSCRAILKKISRASKVYKSQKKVGHLMFVDLWVRCKASLNVKETTRLHGSLCTSFKAMGKPGDAIFHCEQVLKVSPNNQWAKDQLGDMEEDVSDEGDRYPDENLAIPPSPPTPVAVAHTIDTADIKWISSPAARIHLAKTETTVAQYRTCVDAGKCSKPDSKYDNKNCNWGYGDRDSHPINCVDWTQAEAFCRWAGGRLPTEEEWFAEASNSRSRQYPWGDQEVKCDYATWSQGGSGCGKDSTWPVCSKTAGNSVSGLCDMSGNVWEWTSSSEGASRVVRGGSWNHSDTNHLRASSRLYVVPTGWSYDIGFRCGSSARVAQVGQPENGDVVRDPKGRLPWQKVAPENDGSKIEWLMQFLRDIFSAGRK